MTTKLLTPLELAAELRVSRSLAYRLLSQGEIPAVRFGRTVRVRRSDFEEFRSLHASEALADSSIQIPMITMGSATASRKEDPL